MFSPYTPWNNSPLIKNPIAEPEIEPANSYQKGTSGTRLMAMCVRERERESNNGQ